MRHAAGVAAAIFLALLTAGSGMTQTTPTTVPLPPALPTPLGAVPGIPPVSTAPASLPSPTAPAPLMPASVTMGLAPFGASLFSGQTGVPRHDTANPEYVIQPGDRVALHVWGAKTAEEILTVDAQGNVFVPEIGPLRISGVRNAALNDTIRRHVGGIFKDKVEVYSNLIAPQQIGVFVTGHVNRPGHYPGGPGDSFIDYLNKAGGIGPSAGSYRNTKVLRHGKRIVSVDLYQFLLEGRLPPIAFQDGDTIVVERKGASAVAVGSVKNNAIFEFKGPTIPGRQIMDFAGLMAGTSHVWVTGYRSGAPFNAYMTLDEFADITVFDGDSATFFADSKADSIQVRIIGVHEGQSAFAVKRTTKLHDVLRNVPVNRELVDFQAIYVKRKSLAVKQKKALDESLVQLEKAVLTAPAVTEGEAAIRVKEAEMLGQFIARVRVIQPEGRLIVARGGVIADINLEDEDEIIISQKSDVVIISGEVLMPQAIVASLGTSVKDYVQAAGGFSPRADKSRVVIVKPNGETIAGENPPVGPGDQILVLPKVQSKSVQIAATITQILYQIAVGAGVALRL